MAVLDRVEVNGIEMAPHVVPVAQRVLPMSPLPNPALAFGDAAGRDPLAAGQTMRKGTLDQASPQREIRIALGQSPDHVQVVGQDDSSFEGEGMPSPHPAKRRRNKSMWSVSSASRRSARLTVKK
jgi:hypothetical protein